MKSVTHSLCFHWNKFRTRYLAGRGLKVSANIIQKTNRSDSCLTSRCRDAEIYQTTKFLFLLGGRLLKHLLTLLWLLAWKEKGLTARRGQGIYFLYQRMMRPVPWLRLSQTFRPPPSRKPEKHSRGASRNILTSDFEQTGLALLKFCYYSTER